MKLITQAAVDSFRSIRHAELEHLGHFSVLAGLNNSGKSNFLRALNLFFTGEVEPGSPLVFDRDYYRHDLSSKHRKTIRVRLTFDLPSTFKYRTGLEPAEALLGRRFTLTKAWSRGVPRPDVYLNSGPEPLTPDERDRAESFLQLIAFRHIPNRVIPTDLIHHEQQALRDVLIRRLARLKKQSSAVFQGIQHTAESLIATMAADIARVAPDVKSIRLATATSLADLAFKFGYRLTEHETEMEEAEQGSGMQSLLMFRTLHLIDRDYFQRFGWKQAALWAVEEPESSLHTSLEVQVASLLSSITNDANGRMQALATTHSDLMMQYADSGYLVEKKGDLVTKRPGTLAFQRDARQLLDESARFGVSRWVNPILFHPLVPVVLVEGKYDRDFLRAALTVLKQPSAVRVECLEDVAEPDKGGVETLKVFVRMNKAAIKSRRAEAPVLVLLDWDAASKLGEFQKGFVPADPFRVLAWDEAEANPKLDKTFRGIERFYPDRIFDEVAAVEPDLFSYKPSGVRCTTSEQYGNVKRRGWEIVAKGITEGDIAFARPLLSNLLAAAGVTLPP